MGKTGEMTDHVVGEIQCRQGDQMFQSLQLSELEGSLEIDNLPLTYSQTIYPVVVKVETFQFHQMIHS